MLADGSHEVHPLVGHVLGAQGVDQVETDALRGVAVNMGNRGHGIT